jgi:hypothetical protein
MQILGKKNTHETNVRRTEETKRHVPEAAKHHHQRKQGSAQHKTQRDVETAAVCNTIARGQAQADSRGRSGLGHHVGGRMNGELEELGTPPPITKRDTNREQ